MAPCAIDITANDYEILSLKDDYIDTHSVSDCESGAEPVHHGAKTAKEMIGAALQKHIEGVDPHDCEAGAEDAFFVADLGEVYRQHMRWKKHLPRITPHYAVKCNPDDAILRLLAKLGAGFDCASKAEIEQVLGLGVDPERIIYAQPCKTKSYLRYTAKTGVKQMTFDNTDELYKVKELFPQAELFLRISTDDSQSLCRLSQKFGANMDNVPELLALAKDLDLNVAGVAFHVGSGASDPQAFRQAVSDARNVFDQAAALGHELHTLDCGGGFVSETFDDMAGVLAQALDEHFPPSVRIIAEPGRYYTSSAFTLACNVIARRTVEEKRLGGSTSYMLYMNDGVYGNFSCIIFDHQHPVPKVLRNQRRNDGFNYSTSYESMVDSGYTSAEDEHTAPVRAGRKQITYSIWGPTCDGIDVIAEQWQSNETLDVGDWLYFEDMGAYTRCSATRFNGFTNGHETIYVCSEPAADSLVAL
ncbi:Ornithine decarboxylase [Fulvia fulva]|uniref:Ornithine decarboxylase n=1 Tax=Passalora fulva TaxID=5499 RepID=A0A9Q8LEV7_PASFU|nr:Ornithine decarboxylase [Fulvia fulva]KAK4615511.1 Ornithine decarboxylase [Fulvia fulva]KAK4616646.1 Ornithine decarboxylase [Fulvia fulva]UJO16121.1 Ornithine decarboxylase [Fulvia fulva]WPV19565.1 Ornithine decarboxylase [Fulvia fulva]WPV33752.1 Ornithine decarboxylase [Fulvia fulva]